MIGLTKDEFIGCLNFIYHQDELQDQFVKALENLCPGNYCDCWLYNDYTDKYIELLVKLMNDKHDDIRFFLYDMERGKSLFYNNLDGQGPSLPYHTEEELYDYLVQLDEENK